MSSQLRAASLPAALLGHPGESPPKACRAEERTGAPATQAGGSENWDCQPREQKAQGDFINEQLVGESEEDGARLFSMVSGERQKGKESKGRKFHLKVKSWHRCPREAVNSPSLGMLKT